ncbi:MAG: hypothetical protein V2A69_02905 [Pseudomonadota bacterium]
MFSAVFKDLGTRLTKENHLSDLTWAIGKNCANFLEAFMGLFGFQFNINDPWDVIREYSLQEGGRPDLVVLNGDKLFIVENKIDDRNYHFEDYGTFVKDNKATAFGLIVNHDLERAEVQKALDYCCNVKKWEEFVDLLTKKKFPEEERPIVEGYIQYVKEVCSIMEIKEIRFDKLESLYYFCNLVKKIIKQFNRAGFVCDLYSAATRSFGDSWSGQYFSLQREGGKTTIWPFFGIYYGEEPPVILFSFESDWCKDIYKKYLGKKTNRKTYEIDSTSSEIDFKLRKEVFDEFSKATLDRQIAILEEFFAAMFDEISQHL